MWIFVSSFLPFVVSWFLANFWSSWVRSERHVATPKIGLPHAPTRGFGAAVFGSPASENSLETLSKDGSAWPQQWACRNRSSLHYVQSKQQAFNATVQHVDICVILPAFCGFMVSGELLEQLGAFRASCRNPKNRIATRSNAWIWRGRFWSRLLLK